MKLAYLLSLGFSGALLSGCATFGQSTAQWPWPADKPMCATDACTEQEALQKYLQAHMYCRSVQDYYQATGNRAGNSKLIGTAGTIAGAVIVPLAKGSAQAAWSGLSSATRLVQTASNENFSGTIATRRTRSILDATMQGDAKYPATADATAKVMASISMATACSMGAAKADGELLRALSGE